MRLIHTSVTPDLLLLVREDVALDSVEVEEEATGAALPLPFGLRVGISGGVGDGEGALLGRRNAFIAPTEAGWICICWSAN
jgi:hypothetical protein